MTQQSSPVNEWNLFEQLDDSFLLSCWGQGGEAARTEKNKYVFWFVLAKLHSIDYKG